jgi:hypothetical protein
VVPVTLVVVVLLGLAAVAVLLLTRGSSDVATTSPPAATPSASAGPTAGPAAGPSPAPPVVPVDCSVVPDRSAFTVGSTNPCFTRMGERFVVWLGTNTATTGGGYTPSDTFSRADATNVATVQRLMGDAPDGWLGQNQWTRLMTQGPPPVTELRANGIGPLWFGMTAAQVQASGVASLESSAEESPWVAVTGVDAYGCYRTDTFYAVTVKGPSAVRTVEGITTTSTPADLASVFGDRLVTRAAPGIPGDVDYAVYAGDYGYAFFPQEDGSLMILAGGRAEIDTSGGGPHGLCGT